MTHRAVPWRLTFVVALAAAAAGFSAHARATAPVVSDYMLNCQGCHLPDGSGYPAHGVPTLKGYVGNFLRVEGGREFLLRVPGVAQSSLPDDRLANLLNWMIRSFSPQEAPADYSPFTSDEVRRWRSQPLVNVLATRRALVERIARQPKPAHPTS